MTTTKDPAKTPKRPPVYSVRQELPHNRPYELYYAEKVPLLQVFEKAALAWDNRSRSGILGKLARSAGLGRPMQAAECGVYRGHSLVACLRIARDLRVPVNFVGLDSFAGLPSLVEEDLKVAPENAPYRKKVLFDDTSFEAVSELVKSAGFAGNAKLIRGFFVDTLPTLEETRYDFVNIDCDLYAPHIECLEYFYPKMNPGGIIFFDDYHSHDFPMAKDAIDKFLEDKPEILLHLRFGPEGTNHTKCYIEKL
ncbi:TylF/MycF/NovP-related O-methyltransferase [Rhizobium cremeum]|uniref:TylF/MycF/NovP-related O-methyltransferase n=1 Tax=Rhizobium cremeum TaxID=2813827 RepID=UPI0039E04DC1